MAEQTELVAVPVPGGVASIPIPTGMSDDQARSYIRGLKSTQPQLFRVQPGAQAAAQPQARGPAFTRDQALKNARQQQTEIVGVPVPGGLVGVQIPAGLSDDQARSYVRTLKSQQPQLFVRRTPETEAQQATGIKAGPNWLRRAEIYGTSLLPAAGMVAGGIAGSLLGGPWLGGVAGAAVGGGFGEYERQIARRALGLYDVPQTTREALGEIGTQAAVGAATEVGAGAVAIPLRGIARAALPLRLATGQTVRVTPGVKTGVGTIEKTFEQLFLGWALRHARAEEREALQQIMRRIIAESAEREISPATTALRVQAQTQAAAASRRTLGEFLQATRSRAAQLAANPAARAEARQRVTQMLQNLAQRAGQRLARPFTATHQRGFLRPGSLEETWMAFSNAGRSLQDAANPLYAQLRLMMRQPEAATPPLEALMEWAAQARKEGSGLPRLIDEWGSMVPSNVTAPAQLRSDIEKLALLARAAESGANPTQMLSNFVRDFGGGDLSVYDIFRRVRSNLMSMAMKGRLSGADSRTAWQLVEGLTESMEAGLRRTGGEDAAALMRRADKLWHQGKSMEQLGEELFSKTQELSPTEQVAGLAGSAEQQGMHVIAQHFEPNALSRWVDEAEHEGRLEAAFPQEEYRKSFATAVHLLSRSLRMGSESWNFAIRLHALTLIADIGAAAAWGAGSYGSILVAETPEIAAFIYSQAVTSKVGARLLRPFLTHPVGSRAFTAAAARLVVWAMDSTDSELALRPTSELNDAQKKKTQ